MTREPPADDLPPTDSHAWDAGLAAAFGKDEQEPLPAPSVLARLERLTGHDPRVHLRAATTGTGPTVRPSPDEGDHEGRYRILGEIARGGVGVILEGRDVTLGRDLAMKVLRDDHAGNAELVQRFVEEAQIGGQLQHPGIVPVYELGVDRHDRPYFTMKLVRGETLARLLEARTSPSEDRVRFLRIFEQICDAMAYAHARGVVHRDLKPANVLVGAFGEVQIVDWGFAKVLSRGGVADEMSAHLDRRDAALIETVRSGPSGMESQVGSVMGTPSYMPPEQANGDVGALDERTDVFALGAILCEIVTGKPPYVGETIVQTAIRARKADLADALARLDACGADQAVVSLAKECLEVEPAKRPRDAGRLATAIDAYLESLDRRAQQAEVEAARVVERAESERRQRRLRTIFAACAAVVLAVATGLFLWQRETRHRVESGIHEALHEAGRLRDAGEPEKAAIALERARTLAGAPFVDPELVEQVREELQIARDERRDARLIRELEAVRSTDDAEIALGTDAYADIFAAHGLDPRTRSADEIAARTGAGTELAKVVAFALDDWALRFGRNRRAGGDGERLLRTAQTLDDDPWRNELREAVIQSDASRLVSMAEALDPRNESAISIDTLAMALLAAHRHDEALALLERSIRHHRGYFFLHFHLALELARRGEPGDADEAHLHARIALALRPDSVGTRLFLARLLARSGDIDGALLHLEDAFERDGESTLVRLMRADVLSSAGRHDEALAVLDELALQPDAPPLVHLLRVRAHHLAGDEARAVEALRTYHAMERPVGGPRRMLGRGAGPGGPGGPRGMGRRALSGRRAVRALDTDGSGTISPDELPEELRSLFGALDCDDSGLLESDELHVLGFLLRDDADDDADDMEKGENPAPRTQSGRDQG